MPKPIRQQFSSPTHIHVKVTRTYFNSPSVKTVVLDLPLTEIKPNPGQFYMLWIPGHEEIPLSPSNCTSSGELSFTIRAVGPTTRFLHTLRRGQRVALRGPYGNGFDLDFNPTGKEVLVVGGGVGMAPLYYVIETLCRQKACIDVLIGAKTKQELLFYTEIEKQARRVLISTDDGSHGHHGIVTDLLTQIIREENPYATVILCGPEPMLASSARLLDKTKYNYQISLHRIMKCGIGICGSCAIKHFISCREGPVITRRQVQELGDELGIFTRASDGSRIFY
ncbi:MAG: dihydroorotate dehydrogenase electron transfer subunit [Candidatus Ranarchaeia archaeon]